MQKTNYNVQNARTAYAAMARYFQVQGFDMALNGIDLYGIYSHFAKEFPWLPEYGMCVGMLCEYATVPEALTTEQADDILLAYSRMCQEMGENDYRKW